jgi:hypothetical protein
MKRTHAELANSLGRSWAERKAEALSAEVSPHDWPDEWPGASEPNLPFLEDEVSADERRGLEAIARHAAAERWSELLIDGRAGEDPEEEEHDREAKSERLLAQIETQLPVGLQARRVGERVVLIDREGFERTVRSLDHAWQVVAEYEEHRSLRT